MDIYHSIHTITLQRKIPLEEVSSYRSLLYGLSDRYGTGSYRKSENEYYFYMYAPQGVMISLRAARNCGFIKLTINLNSLLYMEIQRVALFSPCRDYMRTLDCNLRDILRDAQLGAPETFMFARVDFSVNAQTPDPLAYIALAHRGGVPNGFKQTYPRFDNKKRIKPIHYAYSYDLKHSTEDYAVSLYSKADQLRDDYNAQFADYQDAQGMLRFEAKYGAAMLQKHFGITNLSYSTELLHRVLQESPCILCKAMQDCFPAGTYYSLAAVQEQLAQAGKSVQRERLGTWIAQTSRMGSACKARRALCAELSGSQYDALMKYQRASGINPVTIGRKWKQRALPSLQSVFGFDE